MPVTFGTVELIPQPAPAAAAAPQPAAERRPSAPDPRDLASLLCQLDERAARVRAH